MGRVTRKSRIAACNNTPDPAIFEPFSWLVKGPYSMQIIGLCRFSYPALGGFQVGHDTVEDRIAYLYHEGRLEERFQLFETVALPCLKAQTDPDFELIIVIGDMMPKHHVDRLRDITADLPQARLHAEPPRKHREVMKEILNNARNPDLPCLQFRFDDDDAVAVDFIDRLRTASDDCFGLTQAHRTVAFDWNRGLIAEYGADGIAATEVFRPFDVAALAMYVRPRCPLTIMNYAHNKINRFMPSVSFDTQHMFVRGHNASNDSRQKGEAPADVVPLTAEGEKMFRKRFAIDANAVRAIFSKGQPS